VCVCVFDFFKTNDFVLIVLDFILRQIFLSNAKICVYIYLTFLFFTYINKLERQMIFLRT
jgi:hypothetical protein